MRIRAASLVILSFPSIALSHHSRAEFVNETIELEGVLTEVVWRNPHIALFMDVTGDDGEIQNWRIEGWNRPAAMESTGVTQELFEVGNAITIAGRASRRRPALLATNILFANGTEAVVAPVEARWGGPVIGVESQSMPQLANAAAEDKGFFRAWYPAGNIMASVRSFQFTEAAKAARAQWDPVDNPIVRCEPPGLPLPMFHARPILFTDEGTAMGMHHSYFDTRRTIHMTEEGMMDQPSRLGNSRGRWEDANTLLIETSDINYPYFHIDGTAQSEAIRIIERYTLSADQTQLNLELTVTDPATLVEPATANWEFRALDEPFSVYECNAF